MFAAAPPTANGCARRPVVHGAGTTVEYNGKVYGTLTGVAVDGTDKLCQEEYLPLPPGPGCVLAPDTPEVRANVVATHTWSTKVMILANGAGINTKAFSGPFGTPGGEFGSGSLDTWLGTHKPTTCSLQVLYECGPREFTNTSAPPVLTRSVQPACSPPRAPPR